MRTVTVLALASLTAFGCGGDEPEQDDGAFRPGGRPAPARVDTTIGSRPVPTTDSALSAPGAPGGDTAASPGDGAIGDPGYDDADAFDPDVAGPGVPSDTRADAVAAPETSRPSGGRRYTVQVAAFTDAAAARAWTDRLTEQEMPAWMSMAELNGQTYHRVRVGVVATVEEARQLGSLLTGRYDWPVWVAPVSPADPVPADAASATRRLIRGG